MTHKQGLSDIAYSQIKTMILEYRLKPGQFVNESQLQEMLSLGRTPVREAILRLAGDDLVKIHPRKGIEIASISPKAVYDIFQVRLIMEPAILRRNYTNLDYSELLFYRSQFESYGDCDTLSMQQSLQLSQLDHQFHLYLIASMDNKYATQMMNIFVDKLSMIRSAVSANAKNRFSVSNREHLKIIDAILEGDIDQACSELETHINISYEEAVKTLMRIF